MIKLVVRGYMTELLILTLTYLFSVPKVTEDISMVFNATVRVLNDSLRYTFFMEPSMGSLLMMVVPKTHMVNLYAGEMFYNFRFYPVTATYCRVDLV